MPAQQVIINADDYGLIPQTSQAVLDAWAQGAISDCSMMATSPGLADCIARARQAGMPAGIHLNLIEGQSLSDSAEIPAFVASEGTFIGRHEWPTSLPVEQIRLEFRRQVQRVLNLEWQPSHLDSHGWVHLAPEVLQVKIELARELGVPLRALHPETLEAVRGAGIVTTDHSTVGFWAENATVDALVRLVEECPGGSLEIITHASYYDPGSMESRWEFRAQELAALTSPEWRRYREEHGIRIVGFSAL